MKQGTISVLVGCHSPVHSALVWISWCKLYRRPPNFKETVCIVIHDWGHWGTNYLDNLDEKRSHWKLGAKIALKIFGYKWYLFCAGHCTYSGMTKSALYKADKYAFYIAPVWWLVLNNITEPKLMGPFGNIITAAKDYKARITESIESGKYTESHNFYLERVNGKRK